MLNNSSMPSRSRCCSVSSSLPSLRAFAAEKPSWQADWESTIQAAKKEAQILIYAAIGPYHPGIFAQFQVAFPEIKVTLVHGNSNRISPRLTGRTARQ